jgi:phosphinothricin acetyltransferase
MSAPTIRPATLADIPAITAIYAHAVRHGTASFELDPPDEVEMKRRMSHLHDGGFPYLAAEERGTLLGYAYAGLYRTRPAYRFTLEDSIYIAPDRQGQGIGRALLDTLIEKCGALGFRQMIAVIGDSPTQVASVALHRAAGFEMIGTLDAVGYKFDRWLDTVLMQRSLGEGGDRLPTQTRRT